MGPRILHAYKQVLDVLWISILSRLTLNWRRRQRLGLLRCWWSSFLFTSKASGPTFAFQQTRKRERIKMSESFFLTQTTNRDELTHGCWPIDARKQKDFGRQQVLIYKRRVDRRDDLGGIIETGRSKINWYPASGFEQQRVDIDPHIESFTKARARLKFPGTLSPQKRQPQNIGNDSRLNLFRRRGGQEFLRAQHLDNVGIGNPLIDVCEIV